MNFSETSLKGACIIDPEPIEDERGFFARSFCAEEFASKGLVSTFVQSNFSFNKLKNTLRGLHFQAPPHQEVKLIRCTNGSVYDVILDLRPDSATYRRWAAVELSRENRRMLYVPVGFAHGYQTLEDESEVLYQVSEYYHPESERGVRWNDPAFDISWPDADCRIISPKDAARGDFAG